MKTLLAVAIFIGLSAGTQLSGCGPSCTAQTSSLTKAAYTGTKEEPKTLTLKITGMTCAGCSKSVTSVLKSLSGVIEQNVQYPGDVATVKYDANKTSADKIVKAIEKLGYKVEVQKEKKV